MIDWKQCQCSDFSIDVDLGNIRRVGKQVYFRIHIEHTAMGVEAHTMNESIEQDLYTELMKPHTRTAWIVVLLLLAPHGVAAQDTAPGAFARAGFGATRRGRGRRRYGGPRLNRGTGTSYAGGSPPRRGGTRDLRAAASRSPRRRTADA